MTNALPTFLPTAGGNTVPCYSIAGPLQIWGNTTGSSSSESTTAEFLGWTRNGIEIQEQAFMSELKSDYSGGEQGPPGDYEWLGEMHTITCELAQFNSSVLQKYERRVNASIAARTRGMLLGCQNARWTVLFLAQNWARLYTRTFVIDPIQWPIIGTPASFPRITFTCLDDPSNADLMPWTSTGWTVSTNTVTFSNTYPTGP